MMRVLVCCVLAGVLLGTGCTKTSIGPGFGRDGITVEVLDPPRMTESYSCENLSLVGVTRQNVQGGSHADAGLILGEVTTQMEETDYLSTINVRDPELPQLFVKVDDFRVQTWRGTPTDGRTGWAGKTATLVARLEIQDGARRCYSTTVSKEYNRQVPDYEMERLPTDLRVKADVVAEAMRSVVSTISPSRRFVYRPIRSAGESRALLDAGACDTAVLRLQTQINAAIAAGDEPDEDLHYNLGAGYECLATVQPTARQRFAYLRQARDAYATVLAAAPEDEDASRAFGEVNTSVQLYAGAIEKQVAARQKYEDQYGTMSGF